nr:MAG TPA: hypothetical protein [Caudoviricetes sp.]
MQPRTLWVKRDAGAATPARQLIYQLTGYHSEIVANLHSL